MDRSKSERKTGLPDRRLPVETGGVGQIGGNLFKPAMHLVKGDGMSLRWQAATNEVS